MQNRLLILTAVALLVTPAAAAAWGGKGETEPNTGRDVSDGYMFLSPAQSTADAGKVYFNGWFTNGFVTNPTLNPNVGQAGTGVHSNLMKAWALLGLWRDCNKDGYIGYGDPGLHEYPAALPGVDTTLCPPTTPPDPIPAYGWVPPHNDGVWVHEFLPLGWEEWRTMWNDSDSLNSKTTIKEEDDNPFDLNDTDARVWVDTHLPETPFAGGSNCYINPQPRGTYQSTGGLVESGDCFLGFRVTDTLTMLGNAGADGTAAGQLSFKDKPRDQSNSTSQLNRPNPWGKESDPAYADVWDCTQPQVHLQVDNPQTGDWILRANISQPKVPSGVNPAGSPSGQVNSTQGGFDQCNRSATGDNDAMIVYFHEGDVVNAAKKVKPSDVLFYNEGSRRHVAHFLPTDTKVPRTSPGQPNDFGIRHGEIGLAVASSPIGSEGLWQGLTTMLTAPVNRDSGQPIPVRHVTFYASVGAAATSRYSLSFPGTPGSYGSENCALPAHQQLFVCDPSEWWPGNTEPRTSQLGAESEEKYTQCADDGTPSTGCKTWGARVGKTYQLRDIDCYDYSANGAREEGVHWGVLTATECQ